MKNGQRIPENLIKPVILYKIDPWVLIFFKVLHYLLYSTLSFRVVCCMVFLNFVLFVVMYSLVSF